MFVSISEVKIFDDQIKLTKILNDGCTTDLSLFTLYSTGLVWILIHFHRIFLKEYTTII